MADDRFTPTKRRPARRPRARSLTGDDYQLIADEVVPAVIAARARSVRFDEDEDILAPPPMPPKTPEEIAGSAEICRRLQELTKVVRQQNLDRAVTLAQMAARGVGPLVEHFAELGRRYAHVVNAPPKPGLRVIRGGED